jgi:hypothetical protein
MSGTAVAARLARREVVRRPWRSLMVLLLVMLPVVVEPRAPEPPPAAVAVQGLA